MPLQDAHGRTIDYLRISVTDRCDLRCIYCMPLRLAEPVPDDQMLSLTEILDIARAAVGLGFRKFRLTGGEPLLRPDILDIVAGLAKVGGIQDLSMTTNGTQLVRLAEPLAQAGLRRINVSLDTVDPNRFTAMTQGGDLLMVLAGIWAASKAGLKPIKLNCVVPRSSRDPQAQAVARFAAEHGFEVRFIRQMNLLTGDFWPVEGGQGGDCPRCNRLRVMCDGTVRPCLFSDLGFSARKLGAEAALRKAVEGKPESGKACADRGFYAVGG